jgi:hypothetical protein
MADADVRDVPLAIYGSLKSRKLAIFRKTIVRYGFASQNGPIYEYISSPASKGSARWRPPFQFYAQRSPPAIWSWPLARIMQSRWQQDRTCVSKLSTPIVR